MNTVLFLSYHLWFYSLCSYSLLPPFLLQPSLLLPSLLLFYFLSILPLSASPVFAPTLSTPTPLCSHHLRSSSRHAYTLCSYAFHSNPLCSYPLHSSPFCSYLLLLCSPLLAPLFLPSSHLPSPLKLFLVFPSLLLSSLPQPSTLATIALCSNPLCSHLHSFPLHSYLLCSYTLPPPPLIISPNLNPKTIQMASSSQFSFANADYNWNILPGWFTLQRLSL